MGCTTADLREKTVINVCNGQNLGRVMELELDVACGRVVALIVCGEGLSSFFSGKGNTVVPWERISRIGKDTILVELPAELQGKCSSGDVKCKEKRWWHF